MAGNVIYPQTDFTAQLKLFLITQGSRSPEQLDIIDILTKLQVLKWLSNPNGSYHLLETWDSERFLSKYLNAPKKF